MVLSDDFYYQPIRLDTINTEIYTDLIAKEGDAGGRGLKVTITENGVTKNTTGITLNLKWEHTAVADLQGLEPFEAVDLTKGIYKLKYPTNMLHKGTVKALIQIIDNGGLAGSRNLKIKVDSTVGDDTAMESSNEFRALASALVEVNGWNDRIDAVEADFIQRANDMEAIYPQELLSLGSQLAEKANQTALNVEKSRIDSFTTLASGSTTGDAELIDGHVGANGVTYPNVGGAIRGQVGELNEAMSNHEVSLSTLIETDTLYRNDIAKSLDITSIDTSNPLSTAIGVGWDFQKGYITKTGVSYYDANSVISKDIPCIENSTYRYHGNITGSAGLCFYKDGVFISGMNATEIGASTDFDFKTPTGCNEIIATIEGNANLVHFKIIYLGDVKVKPNFSMKIGDKFSYNDRDMKLLNADILRDEDTGIQPCFSFNKEVGEELYIYAKVRFPENVHDVSQTVQFVDIYNKDGLGKHFKAKLKKEIPTQRTTTPKYPFPILKAGIWTMLNDNVVADNTKITPNGVDKDFLLGSDPMSIRFTGDCTLATNQDIVLQIYGNSLNIYHSTDASTIKSYNLSLYATLLDLYNAIKNDIDTAALPNFEIKAYNISGLTPSDLLRCKVNLVAQYRHKNTDNTASDFDTWRAFPFYFPTKEKGRTYDIEIVFNKNCTVPAQFILDGYGIRFTPADYEYDDIFNNLCTIQFGDANITSGGVDILEFEIKDKADFKYPNLRIYYAENVTKGRKTTSGWSLSQDVLSDFANLMKQNDFGHKTFETMIDYANSGEIKGDKLYHFSHDDSSWDSMTNSNLRNTYLSNDMIPSFGMMLHSGINDSRTATAKALRNLGYWYLVHTVYNVDDLTDGQVSLGLFDYNKMDTLVQASITRFLELFGEYPIAWDFHSTYECYNQINYLKNHGFQIIFAQSGYGLFTGLNRYSCARWQLTDATYDASKLVKYFDNYIAEERLF